LGEYTLGSSEGGDAPFVSPKHRAAFQTSVDAVEDGEDDDFQMTETVEQLETEHVNGPNNQLPLRQLPLPSTNRRLNSVPLPPQRVAANIIGVTLPPHQPRRSGPRKGFRRNVSARSAHVAVG
jgi:hypothetical protein